MGRIANWFLWEIVLNEQTCSLSNEDVCFSTWVWFELLGHTVYIHSDAWLFRASTHTYPTHAHFTLINREIYSLAAIIAQAIKSFVLAPSRLFLAEEHNVRGFWWDSWEIVRIAIIRRNGTIARWRLRGKKNLMKGGFSWIRGDGWIR